jgi:molecular chaperone Hsp33
MIKEDILRRFLFEELGIRGEWVSLAASWQAAKQHQSESDTVQQQLGQALAAVVMLSATIKFNGSVILQAQGDGAIKTLVAQATHDRKIRGLARSRDQAQTDALSSLFGQGYLALTLAPEDGEPYQGIVPLEGNNLATALENYFAQSEQLHTRLWLFATDHQAVGLLLQELPAQGHLQQDWERIEMLADTLTAKELLELDCEQILYRLFNEEKVRLYPPEPIAFACTCSREKINRTLRALGREELENILLERDLIEVGCDFCNAQYEFDKIDVEALLSCQKHPHPSATRH